MSIKANILIDALGNITVQMQGDLSYDTTTSLRSELKTILHDNPKAHINIDIGGVDFVGSTGICHFIETLKYMSDTRSATQDVRLSNASSEFEKIFRLYNYDESFLEDIGMTDDSTFDLSKQYAGRKRTFEN